MSDEYYERQLDQLDAQRHALSRENDDLRAEVERLKGLLATALVHARHPEELERLIISALKEQSE